MENSRIQGGLENTFSPSGKYFIGCLGAAGIMIEAAECVCSGRGWDGMPWQIESVLIWSALILLQLLTLYSFTRRLAAIGQNFLWAGIILLLWIGFDVPLIGKHAYIVLPLLYGVSQIVFLFDLRKVGCPIFCTSEIVSVARKVS